MARLATGLLFFLSTLAGCGGGDEGPSESVLSDLMVLHLLIERDPAAEPLELVERRIDDERPVHAGQMLRTTGIPAARRQVEAMGAAVVSTSEGRRFKRRLRDAYESRVTALEAHQVVLEGGVAMDPMEQLTAMRAVRQAEEELLGVVREMSAILPRPEEPEDPGTTDEEAPESEGDGESAEPVEANPPFGAGSR